MPCSRFAWGTTLRSTTVAVSMSITVTSDRGGSRNLVKRERVLVTYIRDPSGVRAAAQGLRLAASRLTSFSELVSMTEMLSAVMLSTYRVLPERSVSTPWGSLPTGTVATTLPWRRRSRKPCRPSGR